MSAVLIPLAYIIAYSLVFWLESKEARSVGVDQFVSSERYDKDHVSSKGKETINEYHPYVLPMQ